MRPQTRILYSLLVRIAVLGARSAPNKYCQPVKGEAPQSSGYQGRALGWFTWTATALRVGSNSDEIEANQLRTIAICIYPLRN